MAPVASADLTIAAPRPLSGAGRLRALKSRQRTIVQFCERAGVRYRVTGGQPPSVALWDGPGHGFTVTDDGRRLYAVDRTGLPQRDPERALRVLEILAYGFQDYFARESVCGRGYYVYPVTPDDGRLWLAEIGRRGGRARTASKARSSRRNGLRRRR